MTSVPQHIAIIMDGNGRWAKARGLPSTMGQKAGADAVKRTVKAAAELGIDAVKARTMVSQTALGAARLLIESNQSAADLREAVILRDLQDMDYKEIAVALKVPEGTVKSRINRGRTELARILSRTYKQVI